MTNFEICKAIWRLEGWIENEPIGPTSDVIVWSHPDRQLVKYADELPDYCTDQNAIHKLFGDLPMRRQQECIPILRRICAGACASWPEFALARQRAIAYLQVFGKYTG